MATFRIPNRRILGLRGLMDCFTLPHNQSDAVASLRRSAIQPFISKHRLHELCSPDRRVYRSSDQWSPVRLDRSACDEEEPRRQRTGDETAHNDPLRLPDDPREFRRRLRIPAEVGLEGMSATPFPPIHPHSTSLTSPSSPSY